MLFVWMMGKVVHCVSMLQKQCNAVHLQQHVVFKMKMLVFNKFNKQWSHLHAVCTKQKCSFFINMTLFTNFLQLSQWKVSFKKKSENQRYFRHVAANLWVFSKLLWVNKTQKSTFIQQKKRLMLLMKFKSFEYCHNLFTTRFEKKWRKILKNLTKHIQTTNMWIRMKKKWIIKWITWKNWI